MPSESPTLVAYNEHKFQVTYLIEILVNMTVASLQLSVAMDYSNAKTKKRKSDLCSFCGQPFETRSGSFKRMKLHGKGQFEPMSVLAEKLNISITSESKTQSSRFVCSECNATMKKMKDLREKESPQKEIFKRRLCKSSYV